MYVTYSHRLKKWRFKDIDDMYYLTTHLSLDIAKVKECLKLITVSKPYGIKDVSELEEAIKEVEKFKPKKFESNTNNIISIIEEFIDNN